MTTEFQSESKTIYKNKTSIGRKGVTEFFHGVNNKAGQQLAVGLVLTAFPRGFTLVNIPVYNHHIWKATTSVKTIIISSL